MKTWRSIRFATMLFVLACLAGWGTQVSAAPAAPAGVHSAAQSQATSKIYLPMVSKPATNPVRNGDFESGRNGSWDEYSSNGFDLVLSADNLAVDPHGGKWAAWLGGVDDEISILTQADISLAGVRYLHYWYWIASDEEHCDIDIVTVSVNGNTVASSGLCASNETSEWVQNVVDLNSYAGGTITLEFAVTTNDSVNSNFFLDDVSITGSAAGAAPLGSPALTGAERLSKADFK